VDVMGAMAVKRLFGDEVITIFVRPPGLAVLEDRLRGRGLDSDADIVVRLAKAKNEIEHAEQFDVVVLNDRLDQAVNETIAVVESFLSGNKAR